MALKEKAQIFAIKRALEYMEKDPASNIPKLVDWMDVFDVKSTLKDEIEAVRAVVNNSDSNWYKLIMSLWTDIDPGVRNKAQIFAIKRALEYMEKDPASNINKIREYRNTKPLFTIDFWNDGEYVGGCIAGGRSYCHINANGDIEPCAFMHYSDSNIKEKTLLEAYQSGLFMGYHDNQPFNENMLRPCPVLDNPGRLTELVEKSSAKSTDYQNLESAKEFSDKCVSAAERWAPVAERLWKESGKCAACGECSGGN